MQTLEEMFRWAFFPEQVIGGYVRPGPRLIDGPFYYGDLKVTPLPVRHAAVETIGFLFQYPDAGSIAYLPDVKSIPDETMDLLKGVDILIVDALRHADHPTHFTLAEALAAAEEVGARETWLTHLSHEYVMESVVRELPQGVRMAWDGLRISL
jgi:phosphoribosyl 1,2-cyclic phosphate phosphodiesterase